MSTAPQPAFELVLPVDTTDRAIGPAQAAITLVEYGDFECPNCKQAAPAVRRLLHRYGGDVRFVYRHFPLQAVHPHALQAAEAAEAAGAQGRFWEMYDLLFAKQDHLRRNALDRYAKSLQLDMARFGADMDDHVHLPLIRRHLESGTQSGVRGTPGFFIEGRILDVSFGLQALFDATAALIDARKPVDG